MKRPISPLSDRGIPPCHLSPEWQLAAATDPTLSPKTLRSGALGLDEIVRSACELASALDALHMLGVIHRDVKPSNVMLGPGGAVALTDFGLARARASTALTRPGQLLGTIGAAARELILGQAASPAVDVSALGCTIYECVAGEPPFSDRSFFQVGLAHPRLEVGETKGKARSARVASGSRAYRLRQ